MKIAVMLLYVAALPTVLLAAGAAPVPPRAARSVHLFYRAPAAAVFFNTVCVRQSQPGSYFQVCGFSQGYFGLQELADGRHVAIFSVWDAGRRRVAVLYHAPDVHPARFGGEGTGAHILMHYRWRPGRTYSFAVASRRIGNRTAYAAWLYYPAKAAWKHLVTFSTLSPRGTDLHPGLMTGFYAFIEDFRRNTLSARQVRRALYGPGWIGQNDGRWRPLTQALFTTSNAPWEAKKTVDAGIAGRRFYLQTGGDTRMHTVPGSHLKLNRRILHRPTALKQLLTILRHKTVHKSDEHR